jgi:uncharacterized protein YgfB (UPF0149 family)
MKTQTKTDIAELGRLLTAAGAAADPSETHGDFCGRVCLGGPTAIKPWSKELMADAAVNDVLAHECGNALERLAAATLLDFEAGDLRFRPLLPSDDEPLQQRTAALADWCQGFMHGLVAGGRADQGAQAEVLEASLISEILEDFSEITRATVADESEESEQAFFELAEYVRVSAQLIYDETAALRAKARPVTQEH